MRHFYSFSRVGLPQDMAGRDFSGQKKGVPAVAAAKVQDKDVRIILKLPALLQVVAGIYGQLAGFFPPDLFLRVVMSCPRPSVPLPDASGARRRKGVQY